LTACRISIDSVRNLEEIAFMSNLLPLAPILAVLTFAACGGDPVDAAGEYSLSITNRENGCDFDNWTEGDTSTGVALSIVQDGSDVTGTVGGGAGGVLSLVLGSNVAMGEVSSNNVEMTIFGTNSATDGNCTFTANAVFDAELDGDVLTGDIRYELATNGNPDCASREGCASRQEFNGTRPPQ